jgi:hypothetical protein
MAYEHHVFVSYAHGDLWTPWVRKTFVPRLKGYLELEAGSLEIFVDDQIQTGARWESVLKRKVARSKLMLSLISAEYFHREWCRKEMALMLEREDTLGLVGHDDNYGLLIPIRLGDGDSFPNLIGRIQHHDFEAFADPDLPAGSLRASNFNQNLKKLAKTIARTLPQAPGCCDTSWESLTGDVFCSQLESKPLPLPVPPRLLV